MLGVTRFFQKMHKECVPEWGLPDHQRQQHSALYAETLAVCSKCQDD